MPAKPMRIDAPLGVYYEHPGWFEPMFAEFERRGIPFERLDARSHRFDPDDSVGWSLVVNRMSPSAFTRGAGDAMHYTTSWLGHLEERGVRVINGLRAWLMEISKARQLALLRALDLPYPRARVIHRAIDASEAAKGLRFPVVFKPNIGGSGAGIVRFDTPEELDEAAHAGTLDLGLDHTALVQEFVPRADGRIVRVEVMNGRFLYAIRIYPGEDDFNLCPSDLCVEEREVGGGEEVGGVCALDASDQGMRVEGYQPPDEIVTQVERIVTAAGLDIGGVEYMIDERDGRPYFYDINALSNFVADAPNVIGFDPFINLVDWLEQLARQVEDSGQEAA